MTKEKELHKQIEYLDLLLEKGVEIDKTTLEKIKSEYPELYELILQSNKLRNPKLVKPNPLFITSSKMRIYHEVFENQGEKVSPLSTITGLFANRKIPRVSFSPALTIIMVLVLCFSLFVGGAQAADSARPGDFLYPVDQAFESVRLVLTVNDQSRLNLLLSLANERLEEADAGFAAEDHANAELAIAGFEREMNSINALLDNSSANFSDDLLNQVDQTMKHSTNVLNDLFDRMSVSDQIPQSALDAIVRAIANTEKHHPTDSAEAAESTKTPPGLEGKDTPPGLQDKDSPSGQEKDKDEKEKQTPPGLQNKPEKTPPGLEKDKNNN